MVQNVAQRIYIAPDTNAATLTNALTGWVGIFGYDFESTYENTREQNAPITASGLPVFTPVGGQKGEISFTTPWYATSAAGAADTNLTGTHSDPLNALWRAAGWVSTGTTTATTYTLGDVDGAHQRLAVIWYDGNRRMILRQCYCTPSVVVSPRQEFRLQWSVMGQLEAYNATASIPSLPAVSTYLCPPVQGNNVSLQVRQTYSGTASTVAEIHGLELNLGRAMEQPEDFAAATGYGAPVFNWPVEMGGNYMEPVPSSGLTVGRQLQDSQSPGRITFKLFSDWSSSTKEISVEIDIAPVAVTELTLNHDLIETETINFMATFDRDTTNRRPVITLTDGRLQSP